MKRIAIAFATATLAIGLAVPPAAAASFNWGFSTPWLGVQTNRSVTSNGVSAHDSVRIGKMRFNGGLDLSADHKSRCAARFKSYNSVTDTYVTFGGKTKRCGL
jgi:hypothetical protein